MPSVVNVKVFYGKGISLSIKNRSFREAMEIVWRSKEFSPYDPLKLTFEGTGKSLYMDKDYFISFLDQNITQGELIELTECEELYRNKDEIIVENQTIDPGSLWKLNQKELILVSSDDWIKTKLDSILFSVVE